MKVVLTLVSLALVAVCNADSYLKCTQNELALFFPDYENLSQYYKCQDIGLPVTMTCDEDTVFTFIYQSCTTQEQYIPAPPLENLPTDGPTDVTGTTPIGSSSTSFTLPTPQTPPGDSTATDSTATDSTATDSTATDSTATDSTATDSTATDSTATPSTATDSTVRTSTSTCATTTTDTPSTATPSTAAPTTDATTTEASTTTALEPPTPAATTDPATDVPTPPSIG